MHLTDIVKTGFFAVAVVLISILSIMSHARNILWENEQTVWSDVVEKSPRDLQAFASLGAEYGRKNNTEQGIKLLQGALLLKKTDGAVLSRCRSRDYAHIHYTLAKLYTQKGLPDKAIEHYRLSIESNPRFAEAYNNLGAAYAQKGMTGLALQQFLIAATLQPDSAEAHFNLGASYFSKGLREKARAEIARGLQLNPADVQARKLLQHLSR